MATNQLTYRIFIGCLLTSEIRMHLNQSKFWRQISILPTDNEKELIEVRHQSKDYLGRYLTQEKILISDLDQTAIAIRTRLQDYCPGYAAHSIKICVFGQVFIA
jgi:hypothetical protein